MTSISHASVPLRITLPVKSRHYRPKARRIDIGGGLQVAPGHCSRTDAAKASTGMLHARYLAGAALNAAAKFTEKPFNYFFPGNLRTASVVAGVMNRVIQAQLGQGEAILVTCEDLFNRCRADRLQFVLGYVAQDPKIHPHIILCPGGLALPPNPPPCSAPPGTFSIGYLLLHEIAHIKSISGPGLRISDETGEKALDVGNAVKNYRDTTTDANAYAFLGTWAWDLGLGGQPWNQQKVCLEKFATGQFRATPSYHG